METLESIAEDIVKDFFNQKNAIFFKSYALGAVDGKFDEYHCSIFIPVGCLNKALFADIKRLEYDFDNFITVEKEYVCDSGMTEVIEHKKAVEFFYSISYTHVMRFRNYLKLRNEIDNYAKWKNPTRIEID